MNYADITELPPQYQEQVRRKLAGRSSRMGQASLTEREKKIAQAARREHGRIIDGASREAVLQKKYRNQEMTVDGIRFDSKKEARRFVELREMQRCGAISELRLQVDFTLQEAYTTCDGVRIRAIRYRADFAYYRDDGAGHSIYIVEDVKSKATKTRVYAMKRKLLQEKFGIAIQEV